MNNSPNAERQKKRRLDLEQLVVEMPLRFPPSAWRLSSSPSVAASRRARVVEKLRTAGGGAIRALASVMTETLEPAALALDRRQNSEEFILAKVMPLDEWPEVVKMAPWAKGAKLRIYVDHKDEGGSHLIADLYAGAMEVATPQSTTIAVCVHGTDDENATAELRPNFPTRVFSNSVRTPLDELVLTVVAA